jgi:hypothetical protein
VDNEQAPSTNGDNGHERDARGRFSEGNPRGRGKPTGLAEHTQRGRKKGACEGGHRGLL